MTELLRGRAAKVDVVLEEGAIFEPVFHNLADGVRDQDGEHEPFEEYSVAYFTGQNTQGGSTLFEMGPAEDELDGTCVVDADAGTIELSLPPLKSVDLAIEGRAGWFNLVVYPGGDADRAFRYAEGQLIYSRRSIDRPSADA